MLKSQVLDKGFIEVVDSLGDDLTVVNSARVSFGKRKTKFDKSDERLVRYLAKYKHYSPFRHLQVQFHVKAPEFVLTFTIQVFGENKVMITNRQVKVCWMIYNKKE